MTASLNRVTLIGNLTKDVELRSTAAGTAITTLRLAVNDRVKDGRSGEWTDRANYFNVTVFGAQAEHCATYLAKGRQVAVDGKLRWREWQTDDGHKREAVEVVADAVLFLSKRDDGSDTAARPARAAEGRTGPNPATFADDAQEAFAQAGMDVTTAASYDEDIPF